MLDKDDPQWGTKLKAEKTYVFKENATEEEKEASRRNARGQLCKLILDNFAHIEEDDSGGRCFVIMIPSIW